MTGIDLGNVTFYHCGRMWRFGIELYRRVSGLMASRMADAVDCQFGCETMIDSSLAPFTIRRGNGKRQRGHSEEETGTFYFSQKSRMSPLFADEDLHVGRAVGIS